MANPSKRKGPWYCLALLGALVVTSVVSPSSVPLVLPAVVQSMEVIDG